ncbi:sensor histidine kinase [Streptomyces sp. NPDC002004]
MSGRRSPAQHLSGERRTVVSPAGEALRELFSWGPPRTPYLSGENSRIPRHLPAVVAVFAGCFLAVNGTQVLVGRLQLPWGWAAAVAVLQAIPVPLALIRPLPAWWLSLLAGLGCAALTASAQGSLSPGDPWPWTEMGLLAHVAVTLLAAAQTPAPLAVPLWVLTVLTGTVLTLTVQPPSVDTNLPALALLTGVGLLAVRTLRGRSEDRRLLKQQENLTEFERSRRALLEERTRIARELHDVVAHHMSVVAVQAEAAPYKVSAPPQELTESFASIRANALSALTELRHILGMLRSDTLEPPPDASGSRGSESRYAPQPTLDDIGDLVANVRSAGLHMTTSVSGEPRRLAQRVELSAFRIVQEALSNVLRHAPGAEVDIGLAYRPGSLGIRVVNSPAAAPVRRQSGAGHGLIGMQERAALLGGTLTHGLRDDGWYEVAATLPTGESESENA